MVSKQKKWKTLTEADIEEFIENLDDGEYYPDSEFFDNNDYTMMRTVFVKCRTRMRTIQMTFDL